MDGCINPEHHHSVRRSLSIKSRSKGPTCKRNCSSLFAPPHCLCYFILLLYLLSYSLFASTYEVYISLAACLYIHIFVVYFISISVYLDPLLHVRLYFDLSPLHLAVSTPIPFSLSLHIFALFSCDEGNNATKQKRQINAKISTITINKSNVTLYDNNN